MTWKANKKFGSHGSELMWICTDCGFQSMNLSEYCPHCGIKTGYQDPETKAMIAAAQLIKEYCANRDCEECIFYGQIYGGDKECKISIKNHFSGTVPPEDWEV